LIDFGTSGPNTFSLDQFGSIKILTPYWCPEKKNPPKRVDSSPQRYFNTKNQKMAKNTRSNLPSERVLASRLMSNTFSSKAKK